MVQSLELHVVGRVVVQVGRRRARPRAENEAEAGVIAHIVNELHHFVEVFVGLARKAHNEIAAHGHVWPNGTQFANGAFVFHGGVAAFHGHQNSVRAVLHGQVQVADQLGHFVVHINEALGKFVGVAGGVANALNARHVGHVFNQKCKVCNL